LEIPMRGMTFSSPLGVGPKTHRAPSCRSLNHNSLRTHMRVSFPSQHSTELQTFGRRTTLRDTIGLRQPARFQKRSLPFTPVTNSGPLKEQSSGAGPQAKSRGTWRSRHRPR
jgi:hypothetical protein